MPLFFRVFAFAIWAWSCEARPQAFQKMVYVVPESLHSPDYRERLSAYSMVLPGIYRLNARGDFAVSPPYSPATIRLFATDRSVHPLISLTGARDGAVLLSSKENRQRAVQSIAREWERQGFAGVHIDFEFLSGKYASDFRLFLSELRQDQRLAPKALSVAAFPPLWGSADDAAFFEPKTLYPLVDFIVFMMYDYHLHKPGPVTDLAWVKENLHLILKDVPPAKVVLGIPAYGYRWDRGKRRQTLTEQQGKRLCARFSCARDPSGMLKVERSQSVAYFTDARLRNDLTLEAQAAGLAGTALWRLGFED